MSKKEIKRLVILNIPYLILGLLATNLGEAWRLAEGTDISAKLLAFFSTVGQAFANPMPSFYPSDFLVGLFAGGCVRLAVYLKGKNAKKYRHNMEYGSARWGTAKDIEPFMAPKFEDNIILTKTERLMLSNRPDNPKNARNKNVLIVGGSGSGKTRFWIKPNLLQCNSKEYPTSFVVTDPKGQIVCECGNALLKHGYRIKIFNTINFKKSMRYNPFAYVHTIKNCLVIEKGTLGGIGDLKGSYASSAEWVIFCQKGRRIFNSTTLLENRNKEGTMFHKGRQPSKRYKTRFSDCWFGSEYPKATHHSMWQKKNGIFHPTVKNEVCLQWLIQISSNPDDLVFDGFMGTGSTALAAIQSGRKFTGTEISEEYWKIAQDRIREVRKGMRSDEE